MWGCYSRATAISDMLRESLALPWKAPQMNLILGYLLVYVSTENGDDHRKPQLDTMQRSIDCGKARPRGYICSTGLASKSQGTSQKIGQETFKSQSTGKPAVRLSLLEIAA